MALTPLTPEQFKARFPIFESVPDEVVTLIAAEATTYVDERWIEADQTNALLYMMAHLLAREGWLTGGGSGSGGGTVVTRGPITRVKVGDVETQYSDAAASEGGGSGSGASDAWLMTTEYGKRFAGLRQRSFPSVAVA